MSTETNGASAGSLRARDLGIPFDGMPGERNALVDVAGVEIGHTTLISEKARARTGATAIHPRGRAGVGEAVAAGVHSFNGNGELTGSHWIREAGSFATPIVLTSTHAVGDAHRGVIDWMLRERPGLGERWLLPVVGETWDGRLNDATVRHLLSDDIIAALDAASADTLAEGPVGGGTGMICYGRKGGNGTASRLVDYEGESYAVGVFLQANFGDAHELRVMGRPLATPPVDGNAISTAPAGAGSLIVVVGTDAPLLPGQCAALARRVSLGVGRTGTAGSHFSGDIFLAFSTANTGAFGSQPPASGRPGETATLDTVQTVPWGCMDPFYTAVVQATEEAILNALVAGRDVHGPKGLLVAGVDHDEVRSLFVQKTEEAVR
ncbi:P1 family peptidase [Streptomyces lanatus]|uniref:P1 family peptidase n=1 Tax=Streptomyces lanatus TaxID=66900 RepID=A0ABV1Y607_9ACTN|nr:P1 family peptidase [Streptomyces lanatus]GHH30273.1 aminopeptidase [Streptomyces lanatus]